MGNCGISSEGAKSLAEGLKINETLQELNLRKNGISPEGAKSLAQSLKINSTLKELDLFRNSIGEEGIQCLAEAMELNETLKVNFKSQLPFLSRTDIEAMVRAASAFMASRSNTRDDATTEL